MTKTEMVEAGKKHADDGKTTVPFDCRNIDAKIIAFSKKTDRPFKTYATLRGAFNKGWEKRYHELTAIR